VNCRPISALGSLDFQLPTVNSPRAPVAFSRHSSLANRHFRITPFFSAFPYVSPVSPLSTALTLFDRGGRVPPPRAGRLRPSHLKSPVSSSLHTLSHDFSSRILYFPQLTNAFCKYRGVGCGIQTRPTNQRLTDTFCRFLFGALRTFRPSAFQTSRRAHAICFSSAPGQQ
jgi:hypothetical protein